MGALIGKSMKSFERGATTGRPYILCSLWLNSFLSDLDLAVLADHVLVVDHHRHTIDDAFESQFAVHLVAVGAVADAEVHGAQALFLAPHIEGVRRAILVGANGRFTADAPGILVAVFLEIIADVRRFVLALDPFDPTVLDHELHRIFPAAVRHVRSGVPNDGAVGCAGNRLDMNLAPGPGTASEPARFFADSRRRFAPA